MVMGNVVRGASMVSSIVKIKTDAGYTGYGEVRAYNTLQLGELEMYEVESKYSVSQHA